VSQHYYPDPPLPLNLMAMVSFILGLTSYFMIPVLGAIGAVVTGHLAKQEMKAKPYTFSGEGFATAGLILGYAHLALTLITIIFVIIALLMLPTFGDWVSELID